MREARIPRATVHDLIESLRDVGDDEYTLSVHSYTGLQVRVDDENKHVSLVGDMLEDEPLVEMGVKPPPPISDRLTQ